jgi:hypothetical protein
VPLTTEWQRDREGEERRCMECRAEEGEWPDNEPACGLAPSVGDANDPAGSGRDAGGSICWLAAAACVWLLVNMGGL